MERMLAMLNASGIKTATQVSLSQYSTFRIGGNARLACFPRSRDELLTCLRTARDCGISPVVIGKGSNVVFPDGGIDGCVIFTEKAAQLCVEGECIYADAGVTLSALASAARDASLTGLEFLHGIPGTLGGAVFMNAGAFGGCLADVCARSDYFDSESGKIGSLTGAEQEFSYRTSRYAKELNYTVLGAELKLAVGNREAIDSQMRDYLVRRRKTQPLAFPSAGSVFKRPEGYFAGKLIEDCGLKGVRVGGAEVSELHAGFIVNRGGASAADVRALVELIRERVLAQSGVELECEIRFL